MQSISAFLSIFSELPERSHQDFINLAKQKFFKKNEIIAKTGSIPKDFYIIESGIVRSFYQDESGKEFTRSFFIKYKSTGALAALISKTPSKLSYDCLTDCEVYSINFDDFTALSNKDPYILKLHKEVMELIFLKMEERVFELCILNSKERYLKFKRDFPELEDQITQYQIATYLNITPVQLSRIRKELNS